jgi:hypothetical protein
MNTMFCKNRIIASLTLVGATFLLASCQSMAPVTSETITLLGANEVPPVTTTASGSGTVTIKSDGSVAAHIMVSGMTATAAHIHEAAAGTNGPVIVPFTKTADNVFDAPAGSKLTDAQMASLKAGKLYVNVHSAKNPGGEVRAQLKGN